MTEDQTLLFIVYIVDRRGPRLLWVENYFARNPEEAKLQAVRFHSDELEADMKHYLVMTDAKFAVQIEKEGPLATV